MKQRGIKLRRPTLSQSQEEQNLIESVTGVSATKSKWQAYANSPGRLMAVGAVMTLLIVTAMLTFRLNASAISIGTTYTVINAPVGGIALFNSSDFAYAFCYDYDKSAPGGGWGYSIVSPEQSGISQNKRDKIAAAMQGLSDGFHRNDVLKAIWYFSDGLNFGGNSQTIVQRVNNGTYQPQPVVWLKPASSQLQPMVAPLTNPSTPTPTPTATMTPTQTPTPPPSATPTPVLPADGGGTLWLDANNDGLYEADSEATLGNVQIEIHPSNVDPSQSTPLQVVTSDANGFYTFSQVPSGDYRFYIPNPPNNAPLSSSITATEDNDIDNDDNGIQNGSGEPVVSPIIRLVPGTEPDVAVDGDGPDSNLTIDFGFTGPGEILGKAWSDIDRDGIRDNNEPDLNNVDVKLLDSDNNEVLTATTGSDGSYSLPSIPAGRYTLQFTSPSEGWWLTDKDQGNDDTLDSDADPATGLTDPFNVTIGGNLTVDAGFVQMQIGGYAWDDANGDGLQNESEIGLPGVTIELVEAGEWIRCADENQTCSFSGTATVRYGANGVYAYKTATDSIPCNNNNFGDPIVGVFKACDYQDTSTENATVLGSVLTDSNGNYAIDSRIIPGGLTPSTAYILRSDLAQSALGGRTPTRVNVDNGQPNADEVDSDAIRIDNYAVINFTTGEDELVNTTHDFGYGAFSARIRGEAWNDLEDNGIQNLAIPKAPNVPVTLFNGSGQLVASTSTNATGDYALDGLPADDYLLEFQPPVVTSWFSKMNQGTDEALDSDVNPATGRTDTITLADGAQNDFVDAGIVRGTLAYPPRLPNPGDQLSKLNDDISLILTAIDDENDPITYSASNLPPGLTIGSSSGEISGAPIAPGIFDVTITASDSGGGNTNIAFMWTVEDLPRIGCGGLVVEAEHGELSGNFVKVVTPDGASGAQHIVIPQGIGNEWNGPTDNSALLCFTVETAGRYRILGTAKATSGENNSFYVTVDGSPADGYLWDMQTSSSYVDDYVNHRNGEDPVEVILSAGQHIVAFYQREDGSQLDKVTLELVEELPFIATCGGLIQEAEDGLLSGNFQIFADSNASNGHYIAVAEGTGHNHDGAYRHDWVEYCFTVPSDGNYLLRGTTMATGNYSDSFYVTVNNQPERGYLWDVENSGTYIEDDMNNRGGADPVQGYLSEGPNYVRIYLREDGTRLDKIAVVSVPSVQAAGVDTRIDTGSFSIESAGEEVNIIGTLDVPTTHNEEPELAGINVTLSGSGYEANVVTSYTGKYYIDDVPPGDYTVEAQVPTEDGGTEILSKSVTVHDAGREIAPDSDDDGRTVDAELEYQPPQPESTGESVFLPFLSIE